MIDLSQEMDTIRDLELKGIGIKLYDEDGKMIYETEGLKNRTELSDKFCNGCSCFNILQLNGKTYVSCSRFESFPPKEVIDKKEILTKLEIVICMAHLF